MFAVASLVRGLVGLLIVVAGLACESDALIQSSGSKVDRDRRTDGLGATASGRSFGSAGAGSRADRPAIGAGDASLFDAGARLDAGAGLDAGARLDAGANVPADVSDAVSPADPSPPIDEDGGREQDSSAPVAEDAPFPLNNACNAQTWMALAPDLRGCNLHGADLSNATLADCDLRGADLSDTRLYYADLRRASLQGANLERASLAGTNIYDANFVGARFGNAYLDPMGFSGVRMLDILGCPIERRSNIEDDGIGGLDLGYFDCLRQSNGRYAIVADGVDLRGADLVSARFPFHDGMKLYDLVRCPRLAEFPAGRSCQLQSASGRYAVIASGVNLIGADLSGMDLSGLVLDGSEAYDVSCPAVLPGPEWTCAPLVTGRAALIGPQVVMYGVDLTGVDLTGVDMSGVPLVGARTADLAGCPSVLPNSASKCVQPSAGNYVLLTAGADLRGADLDGVSLDGVNLAVANLDGVDLSNSQLAGLSTRDLPACPLSLPSSWTCLASGHGSPPVGYLLVGPGVWLSGTLAGDFSGLELTAARFDSAYGYNGRFVGTNLTDAVLEGDFWQADFSGATLVGATLQGAFDRVVLIGANLRDAKLTGATLRDAITSDTTTCPDGSAGPCTF